MVKSDSDADTNTTPSVPASTPQDMPYGTDHLRKMFVGGLDHRTTDEKLKAYFEQYGTVIDVIVMKDPKTKRSRGFGFVTFSETSMVDAVQIARPHKIDNKIVESKRAVPKSLSNNLEANATVKKIYLCGERDEITDNEITDYFSKYGNVISVSMVEDKDTKKKKEWAIVEFDDYDAVDQICLGGTHSISGKPVDVKKLLSKDDHAKIQAAKTARENQSNNNNANNSHNNNSNQNYKGGNAANNSWPNQNPNAGQNMNMNGAGYGPVPGWGANNWPNQPMVPNQMGCNMGTPNMMPPGNMGFGPMTPGMYPGNMGMQPMGPNSMSPYGGGYGNMVPNYGMPMSDPSMYGAGGMMSQPMATTMDPSSTNTAGATNTPSVGMPNANNWNYNPYASAGWGNPAANFASPYQQNYVGGPMRSNPASTPSTRSTPYNATSTTSTNNNFGNTTSNGKRY